MKFIDLMNCYNISDFDNNQIVYNELLDLLRRQNVTPVIGAGLSSWAYPLWNKMLQTQAKHYGLASEVAVLLEDGQYEEVASILEDELTPNGFSNLLRQIFRVSAIKEHSVECPEYLYDIPRLFRGPILTTNFDRVIEYLFESNSIICPDVVLPSDDMQGNKVKYALHNNAPILIKMHGDIGDPSNLILTKESYDEVYGQDTANPDLELPMPDFLQKVLRRNPILFLGCSLGTDRTCNVIKKCAENCRQFAFLELPEETKNPENQVEPHLRGESNRLIEKLRERKKQLIGDLNIQPIWYPYGMHKDAYTVFFQELCKDLKITLGDSSYRLISKGVRPKNIFYGRESLLEEIHESLREGKQGVFLQGIGGIGKSETAKQYAHHYQKEYKDIFFLTYSSSLEELICNPEIVEIKNLKQFPEEDNDTFFERKLQLLNTLTDERTLFIIDNFDVDTDPKLDEFLEGNYHVILTTRNSHPGYYTKLVEAIQDWEIARKIFEKNYGRCIIQEDEILCLKDIFLIVEYHTYAIELIAKQMAASHLSLQEMTSLLKKGKFSGLATETVPARGSQKSAFLHLCDLFDISQLEKREQKIMMYLSLAGERGILTSRFQEWAELTSYDLVNHLVSRGWVRDEDGLRFSLHPLVTEVIHYQLFPSIENCNIFIDNMAKFCYRAWYRSYQQNVAVGDNVLKVLDYFKDSLEDDVQSFSIFVSFLWQVGKFKESIFYAHKLYEACLAKYGEASMEVGFTAKTLGGCYFNSNLWEDSIKWYEIGLSSMLKAGNGDSEDLAMAYEKVARCYTWEKIQNTEKAEKFFNIALNMRLRLRDALQSGEKRKCFEKYENYNMDLAEERIGETYMEIGRMYQSVGRFQEALECAQKHEKSILEHNAKNISGLAYSYYDEGICHYHLGNQEKENGNMEKAMKHWILAIQMLKKALESNMGMRGDLAIDTLDSQEALADVYMKISQEMLGMASSGYEKAGNMAKKLLGENSDHFKAIVYKLQSIITL